MARPALQPRSPSPPCRLPSVNTALPAPSAPDTSASYLVNRKVLGGQATLSEKSKPLGLNSCKFNSVTLRQTLSLFVKCIAVRVNKIDYRKCPIDNPATLSCIALFKRMPGLIPPALIIQALCWVHFTFLRLSVNSYIPRFCVALIQ